MQESQEMRYERARKRVQEIKEFYAHVATYVLVNAFLVGINLWSGGYFWAIWPLIGWGIGLAAHGLSTFGIWNFFGPEWEERKICELMEKEERQRNQL